MTQECAMQNLGLAVRAFRAMLDLRSKDNGAVVPERCALVVAGGYDKRLAENREHFQEVQQLVADLGLQEQASTWLDPQRMTLSASCMQPGTSAIFRGPDAFSPASQHLGRSQLSVSTRAPSKW